MSTILKQQKKSEIRSEILDCFYTYCNAKFGNWNKFMENDEFRKMMDYYEPKYGSAVFSTVADIVADIENMKIKDLLADFSNYLNNH